MHKRVLFFVSVILLFVGALMFVSLRYPSEERFGCAVAPIVVESGQPVEDEQSNLLQDTGQTVYVYGKGLIATKKAVGVSYHFHDSLMTNRVSTDQSGIMNSEFVSYPFGKVMQREGASGSMQKYTYTGKEDDGRLLYYGARYYDARLGRFISVDPIPRHESQYVYAANNPVVIRDPDGRVVPVVYAAAAYLNAAAMDPSNAGDMMQLQVDLAQGNLAGAGADVGGLLLPGVNNFMIKASGEVLQTGAGKLARLFERAVPFSHQGRIAVTGLLEERMVVKRATIGMFFKHFDKGETTIDEFRLLKEHQGLGLLPDPYAIAREDDYLYLFKEFVPGEMVGHSASVADAMDLGKRLGDAYGRTGVVLGDIGGANVVSSSGLMIIDPLRRSSPLRLTVAEQYSAYLSELSYGTVPLEENEMMNTFYEAAVEFGIDSGKNAK